MRSLIGAGAGALSGLMSGMRRFERTGAAKPALPGSAGLTGMLLGARQRASLEAGGPLAAREMAQGSVLADGGLGLAMDAGWRPTAVQSMAIPRETREQLQGAGYNVPGLRDAAGPVAQRAMMGWLLANAFAGGKGG